MSKWPYPPGHRRYGEPKEPSMAEVARRLESEYGIAPQTVKQKVAGENSFEIGDYHFGRQAFDIYIHEKGAGIPGVIHLSVPQLADPQTASSDADDEASQEALIPRERG